MDLYLCCPIAQLKLSQRLKDWLEDAGHKPILKTNMLDYYVRMGDFTRLHISMASVCIIVASEPSSTSLRFNEELEYIRLKKKDYLLIENGRLRIIEDSLPWPVHSNENLKRKKDLAVVYSLVQNYMDLHLSTGEKIGHVPIKEQSLALSGS